MTIELNRQAIGLDSKGKYRYVHIWTEWCDSKYIIHRESGLLTGKKTQAPDIEILAGKVKRDIHQQCELEFNSNFKKYLDKGYKDVSEFKFSELTEDKCREILGNSKTDANGSLKPQLCKVLDLDNEKETNKEWYGSYKHDGLRCLMYMKDGELKTASRGGQDYDIPTTYIRQDEYLKSVFEKYPEIILDSEIYRHGWVLSKLSGLARKETLEEDHKQLKLHCYDIVDTEKTFKERLKILNEIKQNCPSDSKLVIVEHRLVKGKDEIMKMHDEAIANGYEGLVVRDPNSKYKPGGRTSAWQKVKLFSDDEYKVLGLVEGLRDEDMCFLMETKEGYQFKAKPIGDRAQKQWYREHINELIGKMATVKHFGMTNTTTPVPNLPVWKCIRLEKDI